MPPSTGPNAGRSVAFDRAASYYDATRGFPPGVARQVAAGLATQLRLSPQSRVLELGVGTGRIALPLRPHVGSYVGVDLSLPMMEVLRHKAAGVRVDLVQGDITQLPLAGSSFDLALAIHVFHLVSGWRDAVRELGRVLRPEGGVVLSRWEGPGEIVGAWKSFLARYGVEEEVHTVGERDVDVIGEALAAEGFTERHDGVAATWIRTTSHADTIDALANRIWSSTWDIPQPAFSNALADLHGWVGERYRDVEQPIEKRVQFRYALFRRPAPA